MMMMTMTIWFKFGCAVFEIIERTYRQTDRQTRSSQYLASFPEAK